MSSNKITKLQELYGFQYRLAKIIDSVCDMVAYIEKYKKENQLGILDAFDPNRIIENMTDFLEYLDDIR